MSRVQRQAAFTVALYPTLAFRFFCLRSYSFQLQIYLEPLICLAFARDSTKLICNNAVELAYFISDFAVVMPPERLPRLGLILGYG